MPHSICFFRSKRFRVFSNCGRSRLLMVMRDKLMILFLCAVVFIAPGTLVSAQGITIDELVAAYEKSFARLHSWDVTYATGHVSEWDGWEPKPARQPQIRWRKSGDIERHDRTEYVDDVPLMQHDTDQGDEKKSDRRITVPSSVDYTDGSKWWRLYGDLSKSTAEDFDLLNQKGLVAEIRFITRGDILSVFPYYVFDFSLVIGERKQWYSITQILKEFRTEIIDRRQNGNDIIITTRSYLPSAKDNPKHFIQISFDSSVGYQPRQLIFPLNTETANGMNFFYVVRDFVEYHASEDGAFFPLKIKSSATENINKLDNLKTSGRIAVSSITINQPVDIPAIEFPPGLIVVVEEEPEKFVSYIWGADDKPLKVLTDADYKAAEATRKQWSPPKAQISTTRIICIVIGILLIITAFALRWLRWL